MSQRSSSQPERIDSIIAKMTISGKRIPTDLPLGPCALCGHETTHVTSIKVDEVREHFSCREKTREDALKTMLVQQDYLRVAEALGKEGVLFRRLETRLQAYLEKPSASMLCRMITFCLVQIKSDPSIQQVRKNYLCTWLEDIRGSYLPTSN